MAKPPATGLDPLLVQFMEWTRANQRHKSEQTLECLRDEIGASRFSAEFESEPPWTTEQLDKVQAELETLLARVPESTRLEDYV